MNKNEVKTNKVGNWVVSEVRIADVNESNFKEFADMMKNYFGAGSVTDGTTTIMFNLHYNDEGENILHYFDSEHNHNDIILKSKRVSAGMGKEIYDEVIKAAENYRNNKVNSVLRRDLLESAIKDAMKTNSTEKYSVGGGYSIKVTDADKFEYASVMLFDNNGLLDFFDVYGYDCIDEDDWYFNKGEVVESIVERIMDGWGTNTDENFEILRNAVHTLMTKNNQVIEFPDFTMEDDTNEISSCITIKVKNEDFTWHYFPYYREGELNLSYSDLASNIWKDIDFKNFDMTTYKIYDREEEENEQPCVNVADYIENGCNIELPEEFVKTYDGKNVIINYDTYPCSPKIHWSKEEYAEGEWEKEFQEKYKGPEARVAVVNSPKTYGDLMKPYVDDVSSLIQKIESGELDWEYIHSLGELWVEGFDFDNDMVSLSIGS